MQTLNPKKDIQAQCSIDEFLSLIVQRPVDNNEPLYRACELVWDIETEKDLPSSVNVAYLLSQLGCDDTTLIVSLLSLPRFVKATELQELQSLFDNKIINMVLNVCELHEFHAHKISDDTPEQAESIRRMLLSMVTDVRVVLIKLAFRVERLKRLGKASIELRKAIARESMDIFSPIANRLGIGQLKWELEDLSFRYLEPQTYKQIAKYLDERRAERENYVKNFVSSIKEIVDESKIEAKVDGRPKHIFSIWKKMTSKNRDFNELFDVRAVRVEVNSIADCYAVLGLVHGKWRHIEKEFDDYIANPKENGYQSLHTAVRGPEGKAVEIQIRTTKMHEFAEHGVAAHWRYKEGKQADDSLQDNINSLRKLLDPVNAKDEELIENFRSEFFNDRVFVLTPEGRVVDLPQGATPLDFAYAVHTEVGHRCRGAKVHGHIVQLTYKLKNGDQVEILTTKEPHPRRDWLIPHLNFTVTSRARNRIRSWYRKQDKEKNLTDGKAIFDKEIKKQGAIPDIKWLTEHYKKETIDDVYLALGQGDISTSQLSAALHEQTLPPKERIPVTPRYVRAGNKKSVSKINVVGVGNLLTTVAKCCNPVPGDSIIGFITQGKGVSVHRQDCKNIINLKEQSQSRLIEVDWGDEDISTYPVSLIVNAIDRYRLLSDITTTLADDRVNVIAVNTLSNKSKATARMAITIEIKDLQQLTRVMDKINQLPNVLDVSRGANSAKD